ncbi:MAG: hypothetical protein K8R21_12800, partial [Leptospira sp.]|nr:hypothetical protein [Leptospira sp.]
MNFEIRLMILHYFLWIFHNTIILINVLGWISPKTRKLNLITLSLTLLSWVGFGYWHGWGYCF